MKSWQIHTFIGCWVSKFIMDTDVFEDAKSRRKQNRPHTQRSRVVFWNPPDFFIHLRIINSLTINSLPWAYVVFQVIPLHWQFPLSFHATLFMCFLVHSPYTKNLITICYVKHTPILNIIFQQSRLHKILFCATFLSPFFCLIGMRGFIFGTRYWKLGL